MAKYCSNCGRKLEEGKVCDCNKEEKLQISNIDFEGMLNKTIKLCKNIFIKPIETVKEFKNEKNFQLGCILLLITSLILGFFMVLVTKAFYKTMFSTYSFEMYPVQTNISISYYNVFIIGTIMAIAFYFLSALVLYLINGKIFKADISYKCALNIVSAFSVFTVASILLSIIIMPLSIYFAFIILSLACLLKIVCLVLVNKELFKLNNTKTVYSVIIYVTIMVVVIYFMMLLFN